MACDDQALNYIRNLVPYQPGKPIDAVARELGLPPTKIIKLASNENPLGMSPKAHSAIERALHEAHRYPEQHMLVQALAKKYAASPTMIVLGNGSNDVLDLIARTFLASGREAISSQYAFAIYQIAAQSAGAKNVIIKANNYTHDLSAMLKAVTAKTRIIWIANPNNPTGTFAPYVEIKQFLEQVPPKVVVVLDEAYYEYLAPKERANAVAWIKSHPNLIVVRTFSKIYGLAGLRIGYGIAAPEVAELLNRVRHPFNANHLAISAATAALADNAFVRQSYQTNQQGREYLLTGLNALNLACLPAYGNFITFKIPNAAVVNQKLLQQGIIIRPLANYGMPDHLRVTIGAPKENESFITALKLLSGH